MPTKHQCLIFTTEEIETVVKDQDALDEWYEMWFSFETLTVIERGSKLYQALSAALPTMTPTHDFFWKPTKIPTRS